MQNNRHDFSHPESALRLRLTVSLLLGFVLLAALTVLCALTDREHGIADPTGAALWGAVFCVCYLLFAAGSIFFSFLQERVVRQAEKTEASHQSEIYDMFRYTADLPYAIVSGEGIVKIINGAMQDILGFRSPLYNTRLSDVYPLEMKDLVELADKHRSENKNLAAAGQTEWNYPTVRLGDRYYRVNAYELSSDGNRKLYFVSFRDCTDYSLLAARCQNETPVLAYIILDNLTEISQFGHANTRMAANTIESILRKWAQSMKGFLREYERDKYLLIFSRAELRACMANDFSILEEIRRVSSDDMAVPLTVSMGIADIEDTMGNREKLASSALDDAIQRGGDQVVLKNRKETLYFGGRVKTLQVNSAIPARCNAEQLSLLMAQASNVIIMGHRSPDFDCIGACVGLARLCMGARRGKGSPDDIRIVTDCASDTFRTCMARLSPLPVYRDMFVSNGSEVLEYNRSKTLLVLGDVNNVSIVEAPELVNSIGDIAIVDHHRKFAAFSFEPVLCDIETTASSASEMVASMLYQSRFREELTEEEATVMLAGIMLDTKNFTHNAGKLTFEAVNYLYSRSANTEVARGFFTEDFHEQQAVSDMCANAEIYRGKTILTHPSGNGSCAGLSTRILASKAADKLLTVRGIHASFALILQPDGSVSVSARSDGSVNVQLIMAELGGGGHYDMAGAQVRDTLETAIALLKTAIDHYLDADESADRGE